ncbi:MAG: sensor histidine kinase [Enterocloster sp.]
MLPDIRAAAAEVRCPYKELHGETYSCDALRLRQILLNLLSNAIKFTPNGGTIVLEVEAGRTEENGKAVLCFTILDNGMGMQNRSICEHILRPFAREKDTAVPTELRKRSLGMAITKAADRSAGGRYNRKKPAGTWDSIQGIPAHGSPAGYGKDRPGPRRNMCPSGGR